MIVRDVREKWDFYASGDAHLPKAERGVFHLKHLSVLQQLRTLNNLDRTMTGRTIRADLGDAYYQTLRDGLDGWSRIRDARGNEVLCKKVDGVVSDESIDRLGLGLMIEIAQAIENETANDPDELGKSEPPSV